MLEARTQENKPFRIFCMKEPDYVMKIMANWMTLDELDGTKTRKYVPCEKDIVKHYGGMWDPSKKWEK